MKYEDVIDFEQLYESMYKCKNGVNWKPGTKKFMLNGIENCVKMEKLLKDGIWKNRKPKPILITYPKRRDGLSICFRDRIYQRSLNDNILYPEITKRFIYDNGACQKGKGTDFARYRLKKYLWNYYTKYGIEGYVLHIDIKKYFPNMNHEKVKEEFGLYLDQQVRDKVMNILNEEYQGDVGYYPGSLMIQIAGIMFLNRLDHFIKEQLRERYYIRYMDDLWIFNIDKERLKKDLIVIQKKINKLGLTVHPKKTQIIKLKKGFYFLGFNYRITKTGKVIMLLNGQNIKHEKRKLKKMAKKVQKGQLSEEKVLECYKSWKANALKGNSYKLLQKMDDYYRRIMNYA